MSGLERPRKMQLLHTPKAELGRQMIENSLNTDEIVFLAASNKLTASDIRLYSPSTCDKMVNSYLRQIIGGSIATRQQKKSDELHRQSIREETIRQAVA